VPASPVGVTVVSTDVPVVVPTAVVGSLVPAAVASGVAVVESVPVVAPLVSVADTDPLVLPVASGVEAAVSVVVVPDDASAGDVLVDEMTPLVPPADPTVLVLPDVGISVSVTVVAALWTVSVVVLETDVEAASTPLVVSLSDPPTVVSVVLAVWVMSVVGVVSGSAILQSPLRHFVAEEVSVASRGETWEFTWGCVRFRPAGKWLRDG
jgi:hypothetical protein